MVFAQVSCCSPDGLVKQRPILYHLPPGVGPAVLLPPPEVSVPHRSPGLLLLVFLTHLLVSTFQNFLAHAGFRFSPVAFVGCGDILFVSSLVLNHSSGFSC